MPLHVTNSITTDTQLPVLKVEITLTDAEIKALPTTPVEVLPAPGVGKLICIVSGIMKLDCTAGAYTNVDTTPGAAWINLVWNNSWDASNHFRADAIVDPENYMCTVTPTLYQDTSSDFMFESGSLTTRVVNKALSFYGHNGTNGNFTGGNAANTLKLTLFYALVDV